MDLQEDLIYIYKKLMTAIKNSTNIEEALPLIDRVLSIHRIVKTKQTKHKVNIEEIIDSLKE